MLRAKWRPKSNLTIAPFHKITLRTDLLRTLQESGTEHQRLAAFGLITHLVRRPEDLIKIFSPPGCSFSLGGGAIADPHSVDPHL